MREWTAPGNAAMRPTTLDLNNGDHNARKEARSDLIGLVLWPWNELQPHIAARPEFDRPPIPLLP